MGYGGPTVSEHEELVALANGNFGEKGQQIVGDALGVFTHDAAGVGAGGVEVAEERGIPVIA